MLSPAEQDFVDSIVEIGDRVLDQDTLPFMVEEGLPVENLTAITGDDDVDEVLEGLKQKELVHIEPRKETIRYTDTQSDGFDLANWGHTRFKTVDRRYVHFTERLRALYEE
ncbi:hypothetical protein GCM10009037_26940 [Halarchaeum grantii]|uniref:Uncharacterized protein n=1 Tax=Halarchaeum grantii TaxID=1193105 RepID=A0A830EYD3_9EURY|nr:hypothetical protein [Halarchaeum grantii]GGL42026.1 hypothetical protein GCM10009037_26940 [Halarchaeum grantii]